MTPGNAVRDAASTRSAIGRAARIAGSGGPGAGVRARLVAGVAALALSFLALPAHASYEEFSTLDVARLEQDDENMLDRVLVRQPVAWHEDWLKLRGGFRSSQGCFTSGQWYMDNQLLVRVPTGDTTRLELEILQVDNVESVYGWTSLEVRFPVPRAGLWGVRWRPTFDKSRQDAALDWQLGQPTGTAHLRAVMGLEDIFNNFWASRQTRVGDESAPYERHPFEPELSAHWSGPAHWMTLHGKWLTPSVKRFDTKDPDLRRKERLWGAKGGAGVGRRFGATTADLAFEEAQASSWAEWETQPGDFHIYRRRWAIETGVSREIGLHGMLTFRFHYQERDQVWRPPISNSSMNIIDRMPTLEGAFRAPWDTRARVGLMYNRVTVEQHGVPPVESWGTRTESRAYLTLQKRFGSLLLQGIEGIELDPEAYDVAFIHDKGFVQLQIAF